MATSKYFVQPTQEAPTSIPRSNYFVGDSTVTNPLDGFANIVASDPSLGSRIKQDITSAGETVQSAIAGQGEFAGQSPVERGTQATAAAFGAIPSVASEFLPKPVRSALTAVGTGMENVVNWLGEKLGGTQVAQDFVTKFPDAAASLEKASRIGAAQGSIAGSILIADQGVKAAKSVPKAIETGKAKLGTLAEQQAKAAQTEAIDAAGKVVQGKAKQAPIAARTLERINTEDVKTYSDLSKVLGEDITKKAGAVDAEFAKNPNTYKLGQLVQETTAEVGGKTVRATSNYVQDAISQLYELYQKTNDALGAEKIKAVYQKANKEGLTPLEINGLAKQYGTEFSEKAFNKVGDPLTSVNAQAFENTRKGIKTTARGFLQSELAKNLDRQISESYTTKALVDKMAEKVNTLSQKIQDRGLVEKIARGLGSAADTITMGGPKAFFMKWLFKSNVGIKTMNSLDIQDLLKRNLKIIDDLNKTPDATLPGKILNYLNDPKLGASMKDISKNITPESVAKKVDATDIAVIEKYLAKPADVEAYLEAQPILEGMGIDKAPFPTQSRFLKEVLDLKKTSPTVGQTVDLASQAKGKTLEEFVKGQIPRGKMFDGMTMKEIGVSSKDLDGFTLKNKPISNNTRSSVVIDWKDKKIVLDLDRIEKEVGSGNAYYARVDELTNSALNEIISQTKVPPSSTLSQIAKLGSQEELTSLIKSALSSETGLDFGNMRVFGSRVSGRSERTGFRTHDKSDLDILVPKKGLKTSELPNGRTEMPMETIKWKGVDVDMLVVPEDYIKGSQLTDIWKKANEQ